jgi:hypothetical protein
MDGSQKTSRGGAKGATPRKVMNSKHVDKILIIYLKFIPENIYSTK